MSSLQFCGRCGFQAPAGGAFCGRCGTAVGRYAPPTPPRKPEPIKPGTIGVCVVAVVAMAVFIADTMMPKRRATAGRAAYSVVMVSPSQFAPSVVCSLPQQVAPRTPFAGLGGGSWRRWGASGGGLDYGCDGGRDLVRLLDDGSSNVSAEYGAVGGPEAVRYVSAKYTAFQYAEQTPAEKQLRQQYADFCDKLSESFYGVKLPETFRKRLLDESTYLSSGAANEYAGEVGDGYVNLSSSTSQSLKVVLDVHFFSSEEEYRAYTDDDAVKSILVAAALSHRTL